MSDLVCKKWWDAKFPDCPPLGFLLRKKYPSRWLRIHSLPESKRYAESKDEYVQLLLRHNTVASETLGIGSECYLIRGEWIEQPVDAGGWIIDPNVCTDEFAHDLVKLNIQLRVEDVRWRQNEWNSLIQAVADERRGLLLFVSKESGQVYAPYDGGADVIYQTMEEREMRKSKYKAWLSQHPEGL